MLIFRVHYTVGTKINNIISIKSFKLFVIQRYNNRPYGITLFIYGCQES